MAMARKNPHRGSAFEDFLKEEGLLEQATSTAMKRVRSRTRADERNTKRLDGRVKAMSAASPRQPGHDEVG